MTHLVDHFSPLPRSAGLLCLLIGYLAPRVCWALAFMPLGGDVPAALRATAPTRRRTKTPDVGFTLGVDPDSPDSPPLTSDFGPSSESGDADSPIPGRNGPAGESGQPDSPAAP